MFPNLLAEMKKNRIKKTDLSNFLGVRYATILDKLNGKSPFMLTEALKIKGRFFPDKTIEYLFKTDKDRTA